MPSLVTRPQDRGRLVSLRSVFYRITRKSGSWSPRVLNPPPLNLACSVTTLLISTPESRIKCGPDPASPGRWQIRETEVIDPQDLLEGRYFSGDLPDDEDIGGPGQEESDDFELSGSGDLDDTEDPKIFPEVIHSLVPLNNHIPERAGPESRVPTEAKDLEENEVVPKRSSSFDGDEDVPNRVSMSSTAQGSNIFERTEVLAALIVGGVVGILFAVFLILLLVYRMKKKDEGSYDLGKKPIYKKAPTNEFYA
ncbi:syndecan-4 isoform X2 [Castor canadensis]|uniref:Syndecan-4 isoform X2 n=1 Tax=Castor canadensis TaxID=51338 RepID=A0AC58MNH2_CASCN